MVGDKMVLDEQRPVHKGRSVLRNRSNSVSQNVVCTKIT